ncbi:kinase-like protein [Ascodesmis nigricans]|uniref:Autophagy-related protein 1 n=1 Tax=Ascodesmis nigricans TaxID=341454 RepID=A0A4S2MLI2_9PEZI|nr:kinase-like protein [Ascodesmis nigricans]
MECMRDSFQDGAILGGRYQAIKLLNKGSFGLVYLAKNIVNEELVAVKCLVKAGTPAAASYGLCVDEFNEELRFHTKLGSHPHIVDLLDSLETENHTFLVLEFCPNGDLYEAISQDRGPLETEHVRDFMLQLVDAVEYMHSRGVYHRDLKPENIFLTKDGNIKIGDFGLATTEEWTEESAVGSDRYMAPEQYDAIGGYEPRKADLWAIGICLLNILFARNPFTVPNETDPLFADYILDRESLFDIFPTMSYDTFEVLVHCLALDPHKRSLDDIRTAIERVVSWTTDDESLDEFCTEEREVGPVAPNREPLRTPSLQIPANNGSAFPWAQALQMTPVHRQLSNIPDEEEPTVRYSEDMFKDRPHAYRQEMGYFTHHPASYDSGLGSSYASFPSAKDFQLRMDDKYKTPAAPVKIEKPAVDAFTPTSTSKSWSDWVLEDEEEEEEERLRMEREKASNRRSWADFSDPGYEDDGYDAEWVGGGWDDLTV